MARATKLSLVTLGDFFHFAVARFRAARLAYGHGTTNAVDEAAFDALFREHQAKSRGSLELAEPSCVEEDALPRLPELLRRAWTRRVRLRAMTLRADRVYRPGAQLPLFDLNEEQRERRRRAAAVLDAVRRRFGAAALVRGADLLDRTLAAAHD